MFKDYGDRVVELKEKFVEGGYEKQFIDLDSLYKHMASTREFDDVVRAFSQYFF